MLFRLLRTIFDTVNYFDFQAFASIMSTNPVLMAIAFHRCGKIDYRTAAVRSAFMSHYFRTGEVYGFSKDAVQAKKCVRDVDRVPATVTLASVHVTPRTEV